MKTVTVTLTTEQAKDLIDAAHNMLDWCVSTTTLESSAAMLEAAVKAAEAEGEWEGVP